MKTDEMNLTVDELEELCRLYMDCKLSVMEEKELEYVLSEIPLTSPSIDEVRSLMDVQVIPIRSSKPVRAKFNWNWRLYSGIAASIAIILSVAICFVSPQKNIIGHSGSTVYIVAYSHGQRLNDRDAIATTDFAMAKADSLMRFATLTECDYIRRANDIITETINN